MGALSDILLAGGCALQIEAIHGERVEVLSGLDAGKFFIGVREIMPDMMFPSEIATDPRAKIVLRFREASTPRIEKTGKLKTDDGRIWNAVRRQEAGFLTNDYELTEVTAKDQP